MNSTLRLLAVTAACFAWLGLAQAQEGRVSDKTVGDKTAGEHKAQMCIGCHGIPDYKASFPEIYRVPKIAGQNAKYLVSALGEYKTGERSHPTMRGISKTLNDQDMADLAAFYAALAGTADAPQVTAMPGGPAAELIKRGGCVACHGANFNKPIDPSYPKLAGQHPDYLYVALKEYQTEHNPQYGRGNAIMKGMAKPFTHPELKAIGEYIGGLPGDVRTVTQSRWR